MEISREKTGDMTATVKIAVTPAEYNENVNKVLKDYQRKANIPGFRPGHVPFGMIRKMYGSAVFADEVNKLVSEALNNYIQEEKLDILGQPMPNMELTKTFDWQDGNEIEFFFDLGFAPEFELKLDESVEIDYYNIKVNDEMLDKYIEDLRQRYGSLGTAEVAGEKDVLTGEFVELDAEGNPLENGIVHSSKLMIDTLKDEETRNSLIGIKSGETVVINPDKAVANVSEIATMLGIDREVAAELKSDFRFTVGEISAMVPAAMEEEFFNRVFPGGNITAEADFRERLREDSEKSFTGESDHFFMHLVQDKLMELTPVSLPDEFLKRWLIESNEGKITAEDLEKDYDKYAASMKWQLLENRIIRDFDINLSDEEIKEVVKERYLPGWRNMTLNDELLQRLDKLAESYLESRQDEVRRLIDSLYEVKIAGLLKTKVKLNFKEVGYEEFVKMESERHS